MANEWTVVERFGANNDGQQVRFTIADGASVSKGTLMELTDPFTATAGGATGIPTPYAGVAAEEHIANKGITSISLWTQGVFNVKASGAIVIGSFVSGAENNNVTASSGLIVASGANVIGWAREAPGDGDNFNVRLNL